MSYTIKTPNEQFTGIRCGLAIQAGVGHTDDVAVARDLAAQGYAVEPDPTPSSPSAPSPTSAATKSRTEK